MRLIRLEMIQRNRVREVEGFDEVREEWDIGRESESDSA